MFTIGLTSFLSRRALRFRFVILGSEVAPPVRWGRSFCPMNCDINDNSKKIRKFGQGLALGILASYFFFICWFDRFSIKAYRTITTLAIICTTGNYAMRHFKSVFNRVALKWFLLLFTNYAGAFTQWRHKSLLRASAGGFMSRRYNVNMAENYSYFSNFEGKYLGNHLKLVHRTL